MLTTMLHFSVSPDFIPVCAPKIPAPRVSARAWIHLTPLESALVDICRVSPEINRNYRAATLVESTLARNRPNKPLGIRTYKKPGQGATLSTQADRSPAPKKEVPRGVDQRMHHRGGENRSRLAPRPSIKQSRDRRQDHVAPVREAHVGDVREPEQQIGRASCRERV